MAKTGFGAGGGVAIGVAGLGSEAGGRVIRAAVAAPLGGGPAAGEQAPSNSAAIPTSASLDISGGTGTGAEALSTKPLETVAGDITPYSCP